MSEQRRIVVGTDGSANGRRALEWTLGHAKEIGASVEVVTAWTWDTVTRLYGSIGGAEHAWDQVKRRQQDDLNACLEGLADPPRVSLTVVEGDPVEVLTGSARDAALLVLGSHGLGHHPLRRALLGSVAEGCIRNTATPVVVVPNHRGAATIPSTRGVAAMTP
jgi:nucleotide-binding universal stress UspA family protein